MKKEKPLGIRIKYTYDNKHNRVVAIFYLGLGKGSADSFVSNSQTRKAIKGIVSSVYPKVNRQNITKLFQKLFRDRPIELGKMQFYLNQGKTFARACPIISTTLINAESGQTFSDRPKQHMFGHTPFSTLLNAEDFFSGRGISRILERQVVTEMKKRFPSLKGFSRLKEQQGTGLLTSVREYDYPYKKGIRELRKEIRRKRKKVRRPKRI